MTNVWSVQRRGGNAIYVYIYIYIYTYIYMYIYIVLCIIVEGFIIKGC